MDPDRTQGLRLALMTFGVLAGGLLFFGGVLEIWVWWRHPEENGSLRDGLLSLFAGLLVAGIPLGYAYFDMVRDILRRGRKNKTAGTAEEAERP